jgi:hypothetical protein
MWNERKLKNPVAEVLVDQLFWRWWLSRTPRKAQGNSLMQRIQDSYDLDCLRIGPTMTVRIPSLRCVSPCSCP